MDPSKISNIETKQFYESVIDEVIESVRDDWNARGSDYRVLDAIKELWRYKALKCCGIDIPEPDTFLTNKSEKVEIASFEEMFGLSSSYVPSAKEEEPEKEDDEDDFDEVEDDDEVVDLDESDDKDETESDDVDDIQEESSDGLGVDTDDEVAELIKEVVPTATVFCLYTEQKSLAGKEGKNKTLNLSLSNCHISVNGHVRVAKTGTLDATMNKKK